jgi:hypothetical protein
VPFLFPEQPMILTAIVTALLINYAVHLMRKWHLVARIAVAGAFTIVAWAVVALLVTLITTHPPIAAADVRGNAGVIVAALGLSCLFQTAMQWLSARRNK